MKIEEGIKIMRRAAENRAIAAHRRLKEAQDALHSAEVESREANEALDAFEPRESGNDR
jgi:hypothetical protein